MHLEHKRDWEGKIKEKESTWIWVFAFHRGTPDLNKKSLNYGWRYTSWKEDQSEKE